MQSRRIIMYLWPILFHLYLCLLLPPPVLKQIPTLSSHLELLQYVALEDKHSVFPFLEKNIKILSVSN